LDVGGQCGDHYDRVFFRVRDELGVSALIVIGEVGITVDALLGSEEALVWTELDLNGQRQEAAIRHLLDCLVCDRIAIADI